MTYIYKIKTKILAIKQGWWFITEYSNRTKNGLLLMHKKTSLTNQIYDFFAGVKVEFDSLKV